MSWSIRGSYSAIWSLPLTNVKWHSGPWLVTVTSQPIRHSTNFMTFIYRVTNGSIEHLQRVWHASREHFPFWIPGSVHLFGTCLCSNRWDMFSRISTFHLKYHSVISRFCFLALRKASLLLTITLHLSFNIAFTATIFNCMNLHTNIKFPMGEFNSHENINSRWKLILP